MIGNRRQRAPGVTLEELLLRHGSITKEQLEKAQQEKEKWGGEIGRTLVDLGFISEQLLMKALAHQLGIRMCNPAEDPLPEEIVKILGVQLCERYGVIAVGGDPSKKTLQVATSDPTNQAELRSLSLVSGHRIEPVTATNDSIQRAIRKYYYGDHAAPVPKPAPVDSAQVASIGTRLAQLEAVVQPPQLMSNHPQIAGIMARLEKLEQLTASQLKILKITGEMLIEKGIVTKEEYLARIRRR